MSHCKHAAAQVIKTFATRLLQFILKPLRRNSLIGKLTWVCLRPTNTNGRSHPSAMYVAGTQTVYITLKETCWLMCIHKSIGEVFNAWRWMKTSLPEHRQMLHCLQYDHHKQNYQYYDSLHSYTDHLGSSQRQAIIKSWVRSHAQPSHEDEQEISIKSTLVSSCAIHRVPFISLGGFC